LRLASPRRSDWRYGRPDMKSVKDYINLLPREEKKPGRMAETRSLLVALSALAWLAVFGLTLAQRWTLQVRLAAVNEQREDLQQQATALQQELGLSIPAGMSPEKASLIQNLLGERVLWSEVFKQFSRTVPPGLWFDSLEGNAAAKAEVKIRGGAFNYALVSEFMRGMENSAFFEKPDLLFAQKAVIQGRDVIGFEIACGIKKTQGGRP